ncbi:MAG: disulfide bond formation protein B [Pelagibacterales bacterium]|nr:disulfide bond formation protein B [Pelagibacterales bacterium]
MSHLKKKIELNIILSLSIFALIAAFFIEYILDHKPCNLCLLERVPYILVIVLVVLVTIFEKFERSIFFLLSLIFLSATILSFYHFGIEQGFIKESIVCNLNQETSNLSKEDLLKELNNKRISCKDVGFKIFGLSLATINTFISLILSTITLKIFLNYEKK